MEETIILFSEIKQEIEKMETISQLEGWHLTQSIKMSCVECKKVLKVSYFLGHLEIIMDSKCIEIGKINGCPSCGNNSLTLYNSKITIKEILIEKLNALPFNEENPFSGFKSLNTGELVTDFEFKVAQDFIELWKLIVNYVDKQGNLKEYKCSYIGRPSHDIKPIEALSLHSFNGKFVISMFKDKNYRFWYAIDRF